MLSKSGPHVRKRVEGRMSDGSDRQEITETFYVASYLDDQGQVQTAEFDHDPQDAEVDALVPRRTTAKQAISAAVQQWQTSQTAWAAATTTAQALNALHLEHVALMRAIRALALLSQIDN